MLFPNLLDLASLIDDVRKHVNPGGVPLLDALLSKMIETLRLAQKDDLTPLKNEVAFHFAASAAQSTPTEMYLIFGDLNHFKDINELYSHDAGNVALYQVGQTLLTICTKYAASAYRIHGDEFMMLVESTRLKQLTDELRGAFAKLPIEFGRRKKFDVTMSFGCTPFARNLDLRKLKEQAEHACLAAKRKGAGETIHWTPAVEKTVPKSDRTECPTCHTKVSVLVPLPSKRKSAISCCPHCGKAIKLKRSPRSRKKVRRK